MATRVSDPNGFFTAHYGEIHRIVENLARSYHRPCLADSVDDLLQEGLMFALEALRHVDLDRGWHGYVKTVVRRRLVEHVHKLSEARTGEWSKGAEVLYPEQEFEGPVELVRRRVAARRALDELRERLSPAARQVLDLTIHPPFALLVMARNEEGRVVEPQCRHMAKFTGLPRRQVRQARIEIWKKSHRVAA